MDPAAADDCATAALRLWRGPAYAELVDLEVATVEAARLAEYRSRAAEVRARAALALNRPDRAADLAEREIALTPLREGPRRLHMLALYRLGRHPDALAAFADFRRTLDDELGLAPSAEFTDLQRQILRHDPALDPDRPLIRTVTVEDPAGTAPRTVGAAAPPPRELIGRESETEVLIGLLGRCRVVTVSGPGGVGKTGLSLVAAHRVGASGRFPHGVRLVELGAVPAGGPATDALGTALGVVPTSGVAAMDRLAQYLAPLTTLLVLDNCEHLVDEVAKLVDRLIDRCPGLSVLATSQIPLAIPDEQVLPLDPLPVTPTGADGADWADWADSADGAGGAGGAGGAEPNAAVRLFLDRARRADVRFSPDATDLAAIAEVCRRLDGLPLAIELAAGRTRHRTPQELLAGLDDRFGLLRGGNRLAPDRHASLADVVAWSYGLLDPAARELFDRVSVFRGGFGLTDAAVVADRSPAEVSHQLGALVDRSLLRSTRDPRSRSTVFVQLETLRAFGAQRLTASGRADEVRGRHALAVLELVDAGRAAVIGPELGRWVAQVGSRFDDLRAAQRWAREHDPSLALRLLAGLVDWLEFEPTGELIAWADAATADPRVWSVDVQLRRLACVVMSLAAAGQRFMGDLDGAVRRARAAADLIDDPTDVAARYPLYMLAETALYRGDLTQTLTMAGRARVLAEAAGDVLRARWCDMNVILAQAYGDRPDVAVTRAQALVARDDLTPIALGWSRYTLGEVLMDLDPSRASAMLEQAVADARRLGDRFLTGVALLSLASVTARHADPARAVPLFAEVIEHWNRLGNWTQRWTTFRTVAELLSTVGDPTSAAVLLGACRRETAPAQAYGPDAQRLAELAGRLREQLGATVLDRLAARGERLSADEVVALVREALSRAGRPADPATEPNRPDPAGRTATAGDRPAAP